MGHSHDDGWDTKPKLDEARVLAPEEPAHRSKKNTRRWCKGKVGVEHAPEIRGNRNGWTAGRKCGYSRYRRDPYWSCEHERACVNCGKVLDSSLGRECPDWHPRPELPQVSIDLNTRIEHNWTLADYWQDCDRPLRVGEPVEVYEEGSGIRGPGRVEEIIRSGRRKNLVYLSVEWKKLRAPDE